MREWKKHCWRCILCHYIYDPDEGDTEHGVKAGVPFEDLPPHWECPKCKSHKNLFIQISEDSTPSD